MRFAAVTSRITRGNSAVFFLLLACGLFWWSGADLLKRFAENRNAQEARFSPPPKEFPKSPIADMNNQIAALQIAVDLEGTAVVYPEVIGRLVVRALDDRGAISVYDLVQMLSIDPRAIVLRGSTTEVDPEAELFAVVLGRLSEAGKSEARKLRAIQANRGTPPFTVGDAWVHTRVTFNLRQILNPDADQLKILDAIRRSALHQPRRPGAKINAVAKVSDAKGDELQFYTFFGGDLPLEAIPGRRPARDEPAQ
jgi:hypothetical protein